METVTWVHRGFRSPRQFARAAGGLVPCGFERDDNIGRALLIPVTSNVPGSEELQNGPAKRSSAGVVLEWLTLRADIYALGSLGPVREGSPIDPLLPETHERIPIWIHCTDRRKALRAVAVTGGAGAQEVPIELSIIR